MGDIVSWKQQDNVAIYVRSVYPFNTPGAFVPHSAINLSRTKEEESPVSQSLDLSVSETATAGANVSSTGQSLLTIIFSPQITQSLL